MIYKSDGTIIVIVKGDTQCPKQKLKNPVEVDHESIVVDQKDQQIK